MDVFDEQFVPSANPGQAKDLFDAKNTFVCSIWSAQIYGMYPVQLLHHFELSNDDRGVYLAFLLL